MGKPIAAGKAKRLLKRVLGRSHTVAAASSEFLYHPLDASKKEIRLLLLRTGRQYEEPVHCTLRHTPLGEAGEYFALSYAWGDPTRTRPILLNGCSVEVTTNLEEFLRKMHATKQKLVLWVDALCINQKDMAERSSQVRIMKDIYSNAWMVFVWLGSSDEDTDRAFNFVEELAHVVRHQITTPSLDPHLFTISS
ncbi:hypothetical protein BU26DRAFT_524389 [Trematosphaeria pertusa]|uniref:Heterokaryon incompatibility domain-containing protein n=1 Tax=Trematosphaeria pertusa TaxID=390896 RepID=A0A6A6HVS3_9PLEO|nr:uncharacterized protein BU26DRAFT_524389 [Trematosphaeria pertusa]KAF2242196.1 hypothetical protein BU26DRAFT_524389 [Trematosphaeria pertusa]